MDRLESVLLQLAQAQQRTETRLEQLADAQQRTEQSITRLTVEVSELTNTVRTMQPKLARADGWQLEQHYIERAPGYFGRWLRQVEVLWPSRLTRAFEQQLDDHLTPDEKEEVLLLDAILRGKGQLPAGQAEIYVALEASITINQNDVQRVREQAALLRRLGVPVVSVVAGEEIGEQAKAEALDNGVAILQNGKRQNWEQALLAA